MYKNSLFHPYRSISKLLLSFVFVFCAYCILTLSTGLAAFATSGQDRHVAANEILQPELVVQVGHTGQINAMAISPDGQYLATGQGSTAPIWLWDVNSGRALRSLGPANSVQDLAFSIDGTKLLVVPPVDDPVIFNTLNGTVTKIGLESGSAADISVALTGAFISQEEFVICGWRGCNVFADTSGFVSRSFNYELGEASAVAISDDGELIAVGGKNGGVSVWSTNSTTRIAHWPAAHGGEIFSIEISADNRLVLSGGQDLRFTAREIESEQVVSDVQFEERIGESSFFGVQAIAVDASGTAYVSVYTGKVSVVDLKSGKLTDQWVVDESCARARCRMITHIELADRGRLLLSVPNINTTAGERPEITRTDAESGSNFESIKGVIDEFESLSFANGGRQLVASSDTRSFILDLASNRIVKSFSHEWVSAHPISVGESFVWVDKDKDFHNRPAIFTWSARAGQFITHGFWPTREDTALLNITCSSAAIGSNIYLLSSKHSSAVFDASSSQRISDFPFGCSVLDGLLVTISPDGKHVVSVVGRTVQLIDAKSKSIVWETEIPNEKNVSNPDGPDSAFGEIGFNRTGDHVVISFPKTEELTVLATADGSLIKHWLKQADREKSEFSIIMSDGISGKSETFTTSPTKLDAPLKPEPSTWKPFFAWRILKNRKSGEHAIIARSMVDVQTMEIKGEHYEIYQTLDELDLLVQRGAISPSGQLAVGSDAETKTIVWDRSNGNLVLEADVGVNSESAIAFSSDETLLALAGVSGKISIWDLRTKAKIADAVITFDGQWLIVSDDGRYDSNNPGDFAGASWVLPDEPMRSRPIEQFYNEYFEPRLFARKLANESLPPITPLISLNRVQPEISIASVIPNTKDKNRVDVEVAVTSVKVEDRSSGVENLKLFRNGQLVGTRFGALPNLDSDGNAKVLFEGIGIPATGSPSIEFSAYAFNFDGVKSETARFVWERVVEPHEKGRRAYVISIGVNDHENKSWNLEYAASDAYLHQKLLTDALLQNQHGFDSVVGLSLVSGGPGGGLPTKSNIKHIFDLLAGREVDHSLTNAIGGASQIKRAGPDDVIIVTYSGHGFAGDDGEFYLFPYDVGQGPGRVVDNQLTSRLVSSSELSTWLGEVDSAELILIVDACNSAAAIASDNFKPGPMGSRGLGQLAYDKGMRLLAASQAESVAFEHEELRHGTMTYALLREGIEEGRADQNPVDGTITVAELFDYATNRVPNLNRELLSGEFDAASRGVSLLLADGAESDLTRIQKPSVFDFRVARSDFRIGSVGNPRPAPVAKFKIDPRLQHKTSFGLHCSDLQNTLGSMRTNIEILQSEAVALAHNTPAEVKAIWSSPSLIEKLNNCQFIEYKQGFNAYMCTAEISRNNKIEAHNKFLGLSDEIHHCTGDTFNKIDLSAQFIQEGNFDAKAVWFRDDITNRVVGIILTPTLGDEPTSDEAGSPGWISWELQMIVSAAPAQ